jgi:pyruvate/2-oxoglutarate dehydrogenase complex dihydrolipoamide acyltransferase (E2) component
LEMPERCIVAIPQETVNDETVRILSWKFASGAVVQKDDLICEAETSKAVMEIHAPEGGTLVYAASVGDEIPVGAMICEIVPEGQAAIVAPPAAPASTVAPQLSNGHAPAPDIGPARLTPLALRVAAEYGIDISAFPAGTLVRRDDVLRKAGRLPAEKEKPAAAPAAGRAPAAAMPVVGVPVDWADLPRRKTVEGGILASGQAATVASFVTTVCRAPKLRVRAEKLGFPSVGFSALVVFEAGRLLRKYPAFNAVHDRQRIGRYQEINIGWAIDGGGKLVVPVVRNADRKTIEEIAGIMQEQLHGYVGDSLAATEFAGGTFTVTDLSGDGISVFQPLISQGQSAILGIGSDRSQADEIFYLTLAFDHQLTEGRAAAQFLGELRERLEAHSTIESDASADAAAESAEPFCRLCQRGKAELVGLKAILLKSEVPAGFVCSLCVAGWL